MLVIIIILVVVVVLLLLLTRVILLSIMITVTVHFCYNQGVAGFYGVRPRLRETTRWARRALSPATTAKASKWNKQSHL